jgi:hypothetical protein
MSTISIEIDDERLQRLRRLARDANQTPDDAVNILLEEGLRMREFPGIQFRDTDAGRQPYVAGIRMPLWHVAMVAREFGDDIPGMIEHLSISRAEIDEALRYIHAYSDEIDASIADIIEAGDQLAATLPPEHVVTIP